MNHAISAAAMHLLTLKKRDITWIIKLSAAVIKRQKVYLLLPFERHKNKLYIHFFHLCIVSSARKKERKKNRKKKYLRQRRILFY